MSDFHRTLEENGRYLSVEIAQLCKDQIEAHLKRFFLYGVSATVYGTTSAPYTKWGNLPYTPFNSQVSSGKVHDILHQIGS